MSRKTYPFPPTATPFPLGNLPFLTPTEEKGDPFSFLEMITPEAERFLRGLIDQDEDQLKQNILYYYRLIASKLPPTPFLQQIESWLDQLEPSSIKKGANEAIGLLHGLKNPEFRKAGSGLLENLPLPTLLLIVFAYAQNANPHEIIYYFSLIPYDLIGSLILSAFRNSKDRAILKKLLALATPTNLSGITALNMLSMAENTIENPAAKKAFQTIKVASQRLSQLLFLARQKLIQATKHTPLALPAYSPNAGIIAKSLGAIYFLMVTPIVSSGRLAIWDGIPGATGLLPLPYWLNVIVRNGLTIGATHQVARVTQDLINAYQQIIDGILGNNLEQRVINGWQSYQRIEGQINRLALDPLEIAYYAAMLIATLQFGDQLFNLNPDTLLSLTAKSILHFARAFIYLAPMAPLANQLLPQRVSQLAQQASDAVISRVTQAAERFNQTPIAFNSENSSQDLMTRLKEAQRFVFLSSAVNYALPYSSEWLTYALFEIISSYSPFENNNAAYQAFSVSADQQLGNTLRATSQFLATVAVYKTCEKIIPKIPGVITQAEKAANYAKEKYLQVQAGWNPDRYIELAHYYRDQGRYEEAFAACEKVIIPTREQLETLPLFKAKRLNTLEKALSRHHSSETETIILPSWLRSAMEAQSYLLAREVAQTIESLSTAEKQHKKVQKGLQDILAGRTVLKNKWDIAEQYLKMGLKKRAIALYKDLLRENEKVQKPYDTTLDHVRELKNKKITTIDELVARHYEIEHLELSLPHKVEAYLVAQGNILAIHRILELLESPHKQASEELEWLNATTATPKHLLNHYLWVEFYTGLGLKDKAKKIEETALTETGHTYEQYLQQRSQQYPEKNLALGLYYEESSRYAEAIEAYKRVPNGFQDGIYRCRMLTAFKSLPETPEINLLREKVLKNEVKITSKLALAEQYRKWKLYSLAADVYKEIIADHPEEDRVENLPDHELDNPELKDRIAIRKTILSCQLALKIMGASNYDHEKILNDALQDNLVNKVILASYYKRAFLYKEAAEIYASVPKPEDAEISKIDPNAYAETTTHRDNVQANVDAIRSRGITTIDQLIANYRQLPYYNDTPLKDKSDLPQFSRGINRYIRAQVNYAACTLVDVLTRRLPTCQTPQDYQELIPLLESVKPKLDQLISHPPRCTEMGFYRLVEWEVTYASLLILSNSNPSEGLKKISHLINADQSNYYPDRNYKEGSLEGVLIPTLTRKIIPVLEKRGNANPVIAECRQSVEQAQKQLIAIKSEKEEQQVEEICKHTSLSGSLLKSFMQRRKLADHQVAKEEAARAREQGKHSLAHVLYLATAQLIKDRYPTIEIDGSASYPAYLRALYQCASTLVNYADSLADASLKLKLYKRAQFYYEEIAKKESAPHKTAHNLYFHIIALIKHMNPAVDTLKAKHADLCQLFFTTLSQFAHALEKRKTSLPAPMVHLYEMFSSRALVTCSDTSRKLLSTQIGEVLKLLAGKITDLSKEASEEQSNNDSLESLFQPSL